MTSFTLLPVLFRTEKEGANVNLYSNFVTKNVIHKIKKSPVSKCKYTYF